MIGRILVCGGRDFEDYDALYEAFSHLSIENGVSEDYVVIEGGARGADKLARTYCNEYGKPCMTFNAPWDFYGKKAGTIRNSWMLKYGKPDLVIAFKGGTGTANMVFQARQAGITVWDLRNA